MLCANLIVKEVIQHFNFIGEPIQEYFKDRLYKIVMAQEKFENKQKLKSKAKAKSRNRQFQTEEINRYEKNDKQSPFGQNQAKEWTQPSHLPEQSTGLETDEKKYRSQNQRIGQLRPDQQNSKEQKPIVPNIERFNRRMMIPVKKSKYLNDFERLKIKRKNEMSINRKLNQKLEKDEGTLAEDKKKLRKFSQMDQNNDRKIRQELSKQKDQISQRLRMRKEKSISRISHKKPAEHQRGKSCIISRMGQENARSDSGQVSRQTAHPVLQPKRALGTPEKTGREGDEERRIDDAEGERKVEKENVVIDAKEDNKEGPKLEKLNLDDINRMDQFQLKGIVSFRCSKVMASQNNCDQIENKASISKDLKNQPKEQEDNNLLKLMNSNGQDDSTNIALCNGENVESKINGEEQQSNTSVKGDEQKVDDVEQFEKKEMIEKHIEILEKLSSLSSESLKDEATKKEDFSKYNNKTEREMAKSKSTVIEADISNKNINKTGISELIKKNKSKSKKKMAKNYESYHSNLKKPFKSECKKNVSQDCLVLPKKTESEQKRIPKKKFKKSRKKKVSELLNPLQIRNHSKILFKGLVSPLNVSKSNSKSKTKFKSFRNIKKLKNSQKTKKKAKPSQRSIKTLVSQKSEN